MTPSPESPHGGRIPYGRLLVAFSVLAVAAVCMIIAVGDESSASGGTCGDNVTWTYDGGALTITGTGAMDNYSDPDGQPWGSFRGSVTSISVGEGVTSVGDYAFQNCGSATSVTLPSTLTSVGVYSFGYCANLETIALPQGLTNIGEDAFRTSGLTSVTIPGGVTAIRAETFWECVSLTSVTISDSVTSIGFEAFCNCGFIREMYMSDSLTDLDVDAFYGVTFYDSDEVTVLTNDAASLKGAMFFDRSDKAVKLATDLVAEGQTCSKTSDTYSASLSLEDITYLKNKASFDSRTELQFLLKDGIKVVFDSKVIESLDDAVIELTVTPVDKTAVSEAVRALIGDNPAFSISFGGYTSLGDGKATITVPYSAGGDIVKVSFIKGESVSSTAECTWADGKATFATSDLAMFFISSELLPSEGSDSSDMESITIALVLAVAIVAVASVFVMIRRD